MGQHAVVLSTGDEMTGNLTLPALFARSNVTANVVGSFTQLDSNFASVDAISSGYPIVLRGRGNGVRIGDTNDATKVIDVVPSATGLTVYTVTPGTVTTTGFGSMTFGALIISPPASITPGTNGQVTFEFTNNTTLTVKAKGSDGTVRSATLTLS